MVKIAVLGGGYWATVALETYKELKERSGRDILDIELTGIWTSDSSESKELATKYELKIYDDVDEVLTDGEVDLVEVCGPMRMRTDIAIRALNAGKHTSIPPPPARSLFELKDLIGAAKRAESAFRVIDVLAYAYPFRKALELAKERRFGRKICTCNISSFSAGKPSCSLVGDAYTVAGYMLSLLGNIKQVFGWLPNGRDGTLTNNQSLVCTFIPKDKERHGTWMHEYLPSLKVRSELFEADYLVNYVGSGALAFAYGATGDMFAQSPVSKAPGVYWIDWRSHKWKSALKIGERYKDFMVSGALDFVNTIAAGRKAELKASDMINRLLIVNAIIMSTRQNGNPIQIRDVPGYIQNVVQEELR